MYRILLGSLLLALSPLYSFAQYTLDGKIYDNSNAESLEYVRVFNESQEAGSITDFGGTFRLSEVGVGDTLRISLLGYEERRIFIDTLPKYLSLGLNPSLFELDQIMITPNLHALKKLVAVDLQKNPINSSQDILRKVPGLFIAQHAGGGKAEQIFLRGFDIDHGTDIQISLDGIPVNMVSHAHGQGYADLHFVIPETIENLDFSKGPYYADKGNFATAGYVDFQTIDKLKDNTVKLELGRFNSKRALLMMNLLPEEAASSSYIAAEYMITDGPFLSPQNFNRLNLFSKFRRRIGAHQLEFQASSFSSDWDASGQIPERAVASGEITRFGAIDDLEGGKTSRQNLSLSLKSFVGEQAFFNTQAYYSRYAFDLYSNFTFFLNDPVNGDKIRQREVRDLYGAESHFNKYFKLFSIDAKFRSGIGFRYDDIHDSELSHTQLDKVPLDTSALAGIRELNTFSFSELEFKTDKWLINPGIRLDHFRTEVKDLLKTGPALAPVSTFSLSPKLNVVFAPNSAWQAYFKAGRGFHSNSAIAVNAQRGREVLPGAFGTDLGTIFKPLPGLYIDLALWYLFMQEEFVYVGDEGIIEPSGRTERKGIDLGVRYQINTWLQTDVAVNINSASFADEKEGGNYIPLAPGITSVGGIKLSSQKNFSASIRYRYLADRPANETNTVQATGYFLTDLVMTYDLPSWSFGISVENLLNEEWKEAQFDTESRLRGETVPVSEIHYTPGSPLFLKGSLSFRF